MKTENVFEDAVFVHVTEQEPYQTQRIGQQKTVSFALHASVSLLSSRLRKTDKISKPLVE